jgi:hypothetical protein
LRGVQRFFMVLKPHDRAPFRLTVLGRKRLPAADEHERIWGFVDEVAKSGGTIEAEFNGYRYRTRTHGERAVAAARPAGEGVYALILSIRNPAAARVCAGPRNLPRVSPRDPRRPTQRSASSAITCGSPNITTECGKNRAAACTRQRVSRFSA